MTRFVGRSCAGAPYRCLLPEHKQSCTGSSVVPFRVASQHLLGKYIIAMPMNLYNRTCRGGTTIVSFIALNTIQIMPNNQIGGDIVRTHLKISALAGTVKGFDSQST